MPIRLDADRELEYFLPEADGPGLCILLLTAFLIEQNNAILRSYAQAKNIGFFNFHSRLFLFGSIGIYIMTQLF